MSDIAYQAVIFDFFGVICTDVAGQWLDRQPISSEERRAIWDENIHPCDSGIISINDVYAHIGGRVHMSPDQVRSQWYDLVRINQSVVDIIIEIKHSHTLALCSNAHSDFIRPILKQHDLEKLFDLIVISSELGAAKPDQLIYRHTIRELRVTPVHAVFVDDSPLNVYAAQAVGITGLHYQSAEALRHDLEHMGVLQNQNT
jgi:HAD superfamily hydrolase (TIGR01509 family)